MTQSRPSLQRVHTRKSEDARKEALDKGVKLTIDGETYTVRVGDVTSQIARRFRREVGCSVRQVMGEMSDDPDIDSVAAMVWLARLIRGEDIELDDIELDYGDLLGEMTAEEAGAESDPEDGDPEA